jgi:hypothetical protein
LRNQGEHGTIDGRDVTTLSGVGDLTVPERVRQKNKAPNANEP